MTEFPGPKINIIGHPVHHSLSPLLHTHWLEKYELAGSYTHRDVTPVALEAHFERIRVGGCDGGNVTIPHKQAVAELCDHVDHAATTIGAVNTIFVAQKDGVRQIFGTNTDYLGFLAGLDAQNPGWDATGAPAIVLGAGGAARAIIYALAARNIAPIYILNRTVARAEQIVNEFAAKGIKGLRFGSLDQMAEFAPLATLLANTTSVGMHGSAFDGLRLDLLPTTALVTDVVYTPLITPLLRDARARGLAIVDGVGMLLHQAVPGFEHWFDFTPEVTEDLRDLILDQLAREH